MKGRIQSDLAERLSLTFQRVQPYERGTNRISASKRLKVGKVLQVPVGDLFESDQQRRGVLSPVHSTGPGKGMASPLSSGR